MAELTLEEKAARVKDLRPIDDVFFEVLADDTEVCQEILRVILDDELIVNDVIVQSSERNLYGRSVRLDALCTLSTGEMVNIEVQRSDNDDHLRRVRYNASVITSKESQTGTDFSEVKDVCVIYISTFDNFKGNSPIYHIDKVVRETGKVIDDGSTAIFVNTAVNDGSTVAELMECFLQKDVNNSKFPKTSARAKMLKTTEGGLNAMCEVMERYQAEAVNKAKEETAINSTIDTAIEFTADESTIISLLIKKCNLNEAEANEKLTQYFIANASSKAPLR